MKLSHVTIRLPKYGFENNLRALLDVLAAGDDAETVDLDFQAVKFYVPGGIVAVVVKIDGTVLAVAFRRNQIDNYFEMLKRARVKLGLQPPDGDLGNRFRFCEIDPLMGRSGTLVFDFEGVANISDSFANACFGSLAEDHPDDILEKVRFSNCSDLIRQSLSSAISQGRVRGAHLVR